jgi:hypothetical protein
MPQHPTLDALPHWPGKTIAMLATVGRNGPHVIPVSAPVRAGDRNVLISLNCERGSLARLRENPSVALLILAEGDIAFTAHGHATVLEPSMLVAPSYAAVQIEVDTIHDHRQPDFDVTGGIDREWLNPEEQRSLGERVRALGERAGAGAVEPPKN